MPLILRKNNGLSPTVLEIAKNRPARLALLSERCNDFWANSGIISRSLFKVWTIKAIGKKGLCIFAIVNHDLFYQSRREDGRQQAGHEKQCHCYVELAQSGLTCKKVRDGGAKNCPSAGRANGHSGKDNQ